MKGKNKRIKNFFDRLSFTQIFVLWIAFIIVIGLSFYLFSGNSASIIYSDTYDQVSLFDSIYFSFISATSAGYGDILPTGFFKVIAVLEVVVSLLLLAIVTSKLISIKQTAILKEIYDISFNERINRLRSALHLFRLDIRKIQVLAEKKVLSNKEISELVPYLVLFNDTLTEFIVLIKRKSDSAYIKKINKVELELMLSRINNSLKRLKNTLITLTSNNYKWKTQNFTHSLSKCLNNSELLFRTVSKSKRSETMIEFFKDNKAVIKDIKELL